MDRLMGCVNRFQSVMILLLLCCLACGDSEAVRVRRYLADTDQSLKEFSILGAELESLGRELQTGVKGDFSKPHLAQVALGLEPRVRTLAGKFSLLVERVRKAEAPPAAKAYHDALMGMFEPFDKGMEAYQQITLEMKNGKGFSISTFGGLAGEILRSVETSQKAMRRAHEERQKLLDQFSLKVGPDGLVTAPP